LRGGILSFDETGMLVDIAVPGMQAIDGCRSVEFFSGILLPGMVNAHCHLELSYLKGAIPRGVGFAGFADAIAVERHRCTPQQRVEAAAYRDAKMYREGISVVGDVCNGASTFGIKEKSPVFYHSFVEGFGLKCSDFSPVHRLALEASERGLAASVTPHSTYSLQDAAFRELAASGGRLSIHFMESLQERDLFLRRGPLFERNRKAEVREDFLRYGSPSGRIAASVPPGTDILLVHNTFVTEEEVSLLRSHFGDRLCWVLCPRSNDYIEGAHPPAEALYRTGCRVAVGTDSLASNDDLSLVEELKALPEIPLEERLRWATDGGARALGVEDRFGRFEPGMRPGAVLLDGIDWERMQLRPSARTRRIL